jgi:CheY-like chemotaxis protein
MLILAVGRDSTILDSRCSILRNAGHVVMAGTSIAEAIGLFQNADFDLVLLCHTVRVEDRDGLISAIRALGSCIPIYIVAAHSGETRQGVADGLLSSNPEKLIKEVQQAARKDATLVNSVP